MCQECDRSERENFLRKRVNELQNHNTELVLLNRQLKESDVLSVIQKEHDEWRKRNFGDKSNANTNFMGMVEELGELAHARLKGFQGIRGTRLENLDKERNAIGDIIVFMMGYCTDMGWNLNDIIVETWLEVKKRNWKSDPVNGGTNEQGCTCDYREMGKGMDVNCTYHKNVLGI